VRRKFKRTLGGFQKVKLTDSKFQRASSIKNDIGIANQTTNMPKITETAQQAVNQFWLLILFFSQNYKEKDGGKIVLYLTSMGVVRSTYAKCQTVKKILRTLMVKFEERDIFMSHVHQQEIRDRMQSDEIEVPQLFVDGQYIGVSWKLFIIELVSLSKLSGC
jgi:glutaredoxin